jgi:hypothetical protein
MMTVRPVALWSFGGRGPTSAPQPCDPPLNFGHASSQHLPQYIIRHLTRSWSERFGRPPASVFKVFICFHRDQSVLLPKLHRHREIANRCLQNAVAGLGWRVRGATNPFRGQVATRLLRGYNINTTATLLT